MPTQASRENVSAMLTTTELLSPADARALTDEVKADASALWTKMLGLYEGGAHTTLGYKSWAAYCEAEFEMSDARAYRILQAARVIAQLPIGSSLPATESQARPLSRLPKEQQGEAWAEVQKRAEESKKPVTAAAVQAIVEERLPQREPTHFGPRVVYLDEILIEQAMDSYSADKVGITTRGKAVIVAIRKPFKYEGALYTAMSTSSGGDHKSANCYRLVPEDEFIGEKLLEVVRGGPYGSYHGLLVAREGKQYVVCGSETTFMHYLQPLAPEPAATPEPPQTVEIFIPPDRKAVPIVKPLPAEVAPAKEEEDILIPQQRLDEFVREMFTEFADALKIDDDGTFGERFVPLYENLPPIPYWAKTIRKMAARILELEADIVVSQSELIPTQSLAITPGLRLKSRKVPDWTYTVKNRESDGAWVLSTDDGGAMFKITEEDIAALYDTFASVNPFSDGKHAQYIDAASRLDRVKHFDLPHLRAALEVPGLQGTVRIAIERRIKKLGKGT